MTSLLKETPYPASPNYSRRVDIYRTFIKIERRTGWFNYKVTPSSRRRLHALMTRNNIRSSVVTGVGNEYFFAADTQDLKSDEWQKSFALKAVNGVQDLAAAVEVYEAPAVPEANFRPHASTLSAALRGLQQHERLDVAAYVEADAQQKQAIEEHSEAVEIDWIEVGDQVEIKRLVARADAPRLFGTVKEVNAKLQYARVEPERGWMHEWFHIDEVFLVEKKTPVSELTSAS